MPIVKNKWSGWANDLFYCRVPLHKSEARGKGIHLLCSEMSVLNYLMEAPHNCAADDVNAMAFEEGTKIIGGHDVVEEFLACNIVPLSDNWSLKVERVEAPLSKVIVPLPKAPAMKGERETGVNFVAMIAKAANHLVGNYTSTEHRACLDKLHHGRLNCV
jgi:hypothetical protein